MSHPPVEVRRACAEDLDDLLLLWATSREELSRSVRAVVAPPPEQLRPRLREALTSTDAPVLLARCEGAVAGYAVLRFAPVLALDGAALHIDHLYVLPHLRRRGVARTLLTAATALAERNGADQILAGAPPGARDTHRFLARLGFSPLVVRRVVGTAQLRRRLTGEGPRRGLDDLLSRRRSLRARATRASWTPSGWGGADRRMASPPPALSVLPAPGARIVTVGRTAEPAPPVATTPVPTSPAPAAPDRPVVLDRSVALDRPVVLDRSAATDRPALPAPALGPDPVPGPGPVPCPDPGPVPETVSGPETVPCPEPVSGPEPVPCPKQVTTPAPAVPARGPGRRRRRPPVVP